MDGYSLSRKFWDFAFENPHKIKPNHCAVYFFAVEQCNRLGWKDKFGLPTNMAMEATGIKSYSVYKEVFDFLVENNLFECVQYSKNQYTSNIIALIEYTKADTKATVKALDKAFLTQQQMQAKGEYESTDSIYKQETNELETKEPEIIKPLELIFIDEVKFKKIEFNIFWDLYSKKKGDKDAAEKKWHQLKFEIQDKIIKMLPAFKAEIKDKQFQPLPTTFLNQKRWQDELDTPQIKTDDNTRIIPEAKAKFSFSTGR